MRRFWKDRAGSAVIWAVFLILILITVSVVVFSGVMVYAKYQACETELQRAAIITVGRNLLNANVRDLELDVPAEPAEESFYANLTETGWTMENGCWYKREDRRLICSLEDITVDIEGKTIRASATFAMPLPWGIGDMNEVRIPMNVRSSILYIE